MKGQPVKRSPRLQVVLPPEVMALLAEVSEMTGTARSTLVAELMVEALPMLVAGRDALRMVKDAPREAQAMLARVSNEATMKLSQVQLELDDLLAPKPRAKARRRKKGPADGAA